MICLITKKGYNWFSGYKFKRDPRGFDILPDATHGTSGWMDRKEMEQVVDLGSTSEMQGILLGKLKDDPDDDDKYSEYVAPSPKNHLNSHIKINGLWQTLGHFQFVQGRCRSDIAFIQMMLPPFSTQRSHPDSKNAFRMAYR